MIWGNDKNFNNKFNELQNSITENGIISGTHTISIGELRKKLDDIKYEYAEYREESNNRFRKLNNLLNEKLDIYKEESESLLIGLSKSFNLKIDNLSEGKPLISDLLKKIARLEGMINIESKIRSTEDILHKLNILNEYMLKLDREEKDTNQIKEQIDILKWVLGEI